VIPQIFKPDVDGTPGYIAPEVLATIALSTNDPRKKLASIRTDQHALAVLIYEYLLNRHPLRGPKIYSTHSAEEDEQLSLGSKALFIEHPYDISNHPKNRFTIPVTALGSELSTLFNKAFVSGLHSPYKRPSAYEWERGLIKTWHKLYPCPNPNCTHHWFVVIPIRKKNTLPFLSHRYQNPFSHFNLTFTKTTRAMDTTRTTGHLSRTKFIQMACF
jgi:DNA-binding helix-hairpin-helix protein with protein kinase domain